MKQLIHVILPAILGIVLIGCAGSQGSTANGSRDLADDPTISASGNGSADLSDGSGAADLEIDLQKLAKKYVPAGAEIIHQVVRGRFAESASKDKSGSVVVAYRKNPKSPTDPYETLVLIPKENNTWEKYELPQPEMVWALTEPIAVFFANADTDAENELLILDENYTGAGPTGAQPFFRTRVYDFRGKGFVHLEKVSEKIGGIATAAEVKKKLPSIAKSISQESSDKLITPNSVGKVKIGMTVAEARKALKGHNLERTSDGEGIALIGVNKDGSEYIMTIYAGEEDPEAKIDENAKIEFIEVWFSNYKTAEGVHPRMKLSDAEKKYGKVSEIMMSEIESREYADFADQPKGLSFRIACGNRDAGNYKKGERRTKTYAPCAYIASISVSK